MLLLLLEVSGVSGECQTWMLYGRKSERCSEELARSATSRNASSTELEVTEGPEALLGLGGLCQLNCSPCLNTAYSRKATSNKQPFPGVGWHSGY